MGRSLQKQESQITLKNHSPGCMWGIFHNLQQNRWHKVVKRLPRARLVYGRHSAGEEVDQEDNADPSLQKPTVEAKHHHPETSHVHKSSMRSRIKAFTEEVYKRKGRHRRSTSYPVRKPPDENLPSHQKGKSIDVVVPQNAVEDSIPTALPDPSSSQNVRLNYLKQNEVDQLGNQPVRDHTLVHGNLMYAIEPSRVDALQQSKLFMDALNLLNVREEMFLKILKDPSLSLANQLQCRRSPNLRYGLNKSMSFSASAPSAGRDFDDLEGSRKRHEVRCVRDGDESSGNCEGNEVLENAASPAAAAASILRKKSDENRVGLMHFKNIREKIKYVIRDRKKEKNRIMMDALHHRIPYGVSTSKKLAEDGGQAGSDFGRSSTKEYKRTTSFDNSLDRYNQLLDIGSSKEAKDESKPIVRRKPATLGRILSLPDIRSHIDVASSGTNEEKALLDHVDSLDKVATSSVSENGNQELVKDVGVGEPLDEAKARESGSSHDFKNESETSPVPLPSKPEAEQEEVEASVSDDSRFSKRHLHIDNQESEEQLDSCIDESQHHQPQHLDSMYLSQNRIDLDAEEGELHLYDTCVSPQGAVGIVQENQIQQFYNDLMHVQGDDSKNNAEFNYVRGVLELSGFTKGETLGKWHSAEYPLNPSMFEEVVDQQEPYGASANQEDGISNQLLLFDLINQVLLQIHERSFCYWPTPLTTRSSIHPLPKGSRVLEEVWAEIRWLLSSAPQFDQAMDDAVSRDLGKNDGWMNLQVDAECVGLELEELIFDDLVEEIFASSFRCVLWC